MKINDIQIDGFGVWSGLELKDLSGKLTVIYGPNEAGKTTLMEFVRTQLFGLNESRRGRYLPPVHGGGAGGAAGPGRAEKAEKADRAQCDGSDGE